VGEPGADSPFIDPKQIETRKLEIKPGVRFRIKVTRVSATVDFSILIWNPKRRRHDEHAVTSIIDLEHIYPEHKEQVGAFLGEGWVDDSVVADPALFAEQAVAEAIMERIELLVENGGIEMNIYTRFPGHEDTISIERDEAEDYAVFSTR
jgi:hypothetical protein